MEEMNESSSVEPNKEMPETTYYLGYLYHGAKDTFRYSKSHDYSDPAINSTDGSSTLGTGLYLTDSPAEAKNYSLIRQQKPQPLPLVYSVYAAECKFLDLRSQNSGKRTREGIPYRVQLPKEFVKKWKNYFYKYLTQEREKYTPTEPKVEETSDSQHVARRIKRNDSSNRLRKLDQYFHYLDEIAKLDEIDLRIMLGSAPAIKNEAQYKGNQMSPRWSGLFTRFMIDELQYDGVIYDEPSEHDDKVSSTFVIYSLDKVEVSATPLANQELGDLINLE
jgi:hypothetical protein